MTDSPSPTSVTDSDRYREVMAERFGEDLAPLEGPDPAGARIRAVATIAAIGNWVAANIGIPAPFFASFYVRVDTIGQLLDIAAARGLDVRYDAEGWPLPLTIDVGDPTAMRADVMVTVRRP